ncbi:hypothetical protein [Flavobacterium foetidum]|uniref:hypothetical protein n=1 Tax=Flavobacterium foetidum TaxID=2026681 RepID=UPI001074E1A6|nr:hypothetical protein [Flavobacterium foetidum]KAF2509097.1 hypothetical protein E0W73_18995 [Flavobacterium foetidum]
MKNINIIIIILTLYSCNGQKTETYWKAEQVARIDNKPIWGITESYMEMISKMQIHLSVSNDSLIFSYPYKKKLKISEFKSFTNCRIKETGQLLDSVYEIKNEGNKLLIKFYYAERDEENRFVLNLTNISKDKYLEENQKLQAERNKLKAMIKPTDLSGLNLSISRPSYFNTGIDLNMLNPIALAESLCDIKGSFANSSKDTFEIDGRSFDYNYYEIENPQQSLAHIQTINFSKLVFVTNPTSNSNYAVVVSEDDVEKRTIESLFNTINSNQKDAIIDNIGLPFRSNEGIHGIASSFGIRWKNKNQIIKLLIKTAQAIYDRFSDDDYVLSEKPSENEVANVFKHYLNDVAKTTIKIIIITPEFDSLMNSKTANRPKT